MSLYHDSLALQILSDPCASFPLKAALRTFLDRDPVDALNDAEVLTKALREHLQMIQGGR